MPTAIDEQGDTGWHDSGQKRSATHFRLVAAWLPTTQDADACRTAIRSLKGDLSQGRAFPEFHYTDLGHNPGRRRAFFEAVAVFDYRFAVASFDKQPRWRERIAPAIIFRMCAVSLAASLRPSYVQAEAALPPDPKGRPVQLREQLILDDNGDPRYLAAVTEAFHRLGTFDCGCRRPERLTGPRPRFVKSQQDELIQLADMLCGAAGDHLGGRSEWFGMVRDRCVGFDELA